MKCFDVYSTRPDFCAWRHLLLLCVCVCVYVLYVRSPEAPIVTRFQLRFS